MSLFFYLDDKYAVALKYHKVEPERECALGLNCATGFPVVCHMNFIKEIKAFSN